MLYPTILIIEDDKDVVQIVEKILRAEKFTTFSAPNAKQGYDKIYSQKPDLIILDINLPDEDGFQVCKNLRNDEKTKDIPIIFLSTRTTEFDKVLGLNLGGDDYLTKPFGERELIARINAVLRRKGMKKDMHLMKAGKICINLDSRHVTLAGRQVDLTPKEFELLCLLLKKRNKVLTREFILETLGGYEYTVIFKTVDMHIKRLRKKLGRYGDKIVSVRGIGYMFEE